MPSSPHSPRYFSVNWSHEDIFEREPIQFGDFYKPGVGHDYEEMPKGKSIAHLLDDYQEVCESQYVMSCYDHIYHVKSCVTMDDGTLCYVMFSISRHMHLHNHIPSPPLL